MENGSLKDELCGIVHRITYQNISNGYTVAVLNTPDGEITVVGTMPLIVEGDNLKLTGSYVIHSAYGRQFSVSSFEKQMPTTAAAILRYLSAGVIKGVGPSTAKNLVEMFGEKTLSVIENNPDELTRVKGISKERAYNISNNFKMQFSIRDVMLMLGEYKISPEDSIKVYKVLGQNAVEIIKNNPYVLCKDNIGFPFETVEDIAASFNVENNDPMRICSGIEYVLRKNLLNGHTCLPKDKLIKVSASLLDCTVETVEEILYNMQLSFLVESETVDKCEYIALPNYCAAERFAAAKLCAMDSYDQARLNLSTNELEFVEKAIGITLDEKQKEAVFAAFNNAVFVLTGGPGTGKTTTLKAMIELFEYRDMHIELAAPTGRAAKRMSELTGREAKTIHRLLEVSWTDDNDTPIFCRDEQNPLECDVIIVDEVSMVDAVVFESLLRALKMGCKIILVGDTDQLPSVSAGNILNDLIMSECFSCVRLTKVFRQAQQSAIITTAHSIIKGEIPDLSIRDSDLFFIEKYDEDNAIDTLCSLCEGRLENAYGFDSFKDIQVLCPSRKLPLGTVNINEILQNRLNPKTAKTNEFVYKGYTLRTNDKVMQIKNNYDITYTKDNGEVGCGAFNGDVGTIESIDLRNDKIKVRFDDRIVTYSREEAFQLEPAYAVTVHKSQGSEFECVILPLLSVPEKLCYRNLLYTAVTRAKKLLIIIGSKDVFKAMTENDRKTLRYTLLKKFLKENMV